MTLAELFTELSPKERSALAAAAELNGTYLWQIARRWKGKRPSIGAICRLAAADPRLSVTELVEEFSDAPHANRASKAASSERAHAQPVPSPSKCLAAGDPPREPAHA